MPNPIDVARAKRAKIVREVTRLQQEAAHLDDFIRTYEALSADSGGEDKSSAGPPEPLSVTVERLRELGGHVTGGNGSAKDRADTKPSSNKERVLRAARELIQ